MKTIGDLRTYLKENDELPDEIPLTVMVAETSLGPTPSVGVDHFGVGIDWDAQQCIFRPNVLLTKKTADAVEYEELMSVVMTYLWDHRGKKSFDYYSKLFMKHLKKKPDWFKGNI